MKPPKKTTNGSPRSLKIVTRQEPNRTAMALKRLGVTADQLAAAPQISPLLRRAEGGLSQVIEAMRFSADGLVTAFLEKYDSITPGDRERLSIEAIALAAKLDITHLLGSIMVSLQAQAVSLTKIIAMTSHPKITEARVAYGLLPLGEKDRTALDVAVGFLPSPRGPVFVGKAVFGSGQNMMDQQRDDDDEADHYIDPNKLFPPVNVMLDKLQAIRQRQLPEKTEKDDEQKRN